MAKVKQLGSNKPSSTPTPMPGTLRDKLNQMTINVALAAGIITDLGNAKGEFIFEHSDENIDAHYAIVNGYAVRVSSGLMDKLADCKNVKESDELLGGCRFIKDFSSKEEGYTGREYFRLALPAGIRLKASADVRIGVEPVEA